MTTLLRIRKIASSTVASNGYPRYGEVYKGVFSALLRKNKMQYSHRHYQLITHAAIEDTMIKPMINTCMERLAGGNAMPITNHVEPYENQKTNP